MLSCCEPTDTKYFPVGENACEIDDPNFIEMNFESRISQFINFFAFVTYHTVNGIFVTAEFG